jgi:hypothetical protein
MKVGDKVRIKDGASAWLKERNYWIDDWPESIDGMIGKIINDYTKLYGDDSHYEIDTVPGCGVHPKWLSFDEPD